MHQLPKTSKQRFQEFLKKFRAGKLKSEFDEDQDGLKPGGEDPEDEDGSSGDFDFDQGDDQKESGRKRKLTPEQRQKRRG